MFQYQGNFIKNFLIFNINNFTNVFSFLQGNLCQF